MAAEEALLDQLSSFDREERRQALSALVKEKPHAPPPRPQVNMHVHTFFSFNGEGWSPTRVVWEARRQALYAVAACDFDVLDALEETFEAADLLGVRAAVGFESRVFFEEYRDHEINSPGEPGVFYFMGMGFRERPPEGTPAADGFRDMQDRAHQRNRDLIERINERLDGLALDYENDVLPLTPAGNATERHIVRSYFEKALEEKGGEEAAAAYWAKQLDEDPAEMKTAIQDRNGFMNLLRSRLMKRGGLAYVQPTEETFPPLDTVIEMIRGCRAIPMSTWLDGTRSGEAKPREQLECLMAKGVEAVNIVPDRNWNLEDPEERERKVAELHRYVQVANSLDLPINVGTELNKPGQRFVDDFEAAPMKPLAATFLKGAQIMVGHTRLLRYADVSYIDEAANQEFASRKARNEFFAAVGALPAPDRTVCRRLTEHGPEKAYGYIRDCVVKGRW